MLILYILMTFASKEKEEEKQTDKSEQPYRKKQTWGSKN